MAHVSNEQVSPISPLAPNSSWSGESENDSSTSLDRSSLSTVTGLDISDPAPPTSKGITLDVCSTPERAPRTPLKNETPNAKKRHDVDHPNDQATWCPPLLQRRTFRVFAAIFMLLTIGVEAIFIVSEKHQGLAAAPFGVTTRYAWTYGPTAVITAWLSETNLGTRNFLFRS
ncbi:hypothetical protein B0T21DRAFT_361823 [Apiosordaria backusii]|uniref:Uncharacterized protein n=1 Tax=Apiosordaria backusii TaxID=314023 RepID=A0AA40BRE9_9PEZI|nr:hypothetical protein B0T21DRAFT_361823 [Apiosordaria backusii]